METAVRAQVMDGPDRGLVFESSEPLVVGTSSENQLVLTDPTISRYHVELQPDDGVQVRDLGSRNNTWHFVDEPHRTPRFQVAGGLQIRQQQLRRPCLQPLLAGGRQRNPQKRHSDIMSPLSKNCDASRSGPRIAGHLVLQPAERRFANRRWPSWEEAVLVGSGGFRGCA